MHHCSPDPDDLYRYATRYGAATDHTPPVELFERHARDVAAQSGFVHRPGWVTRPGLGLAIAKQLIEAHAGTIGIESGPGATVAVFLPLGAAAVPRSGVIQSGA